MTRVVIVGEAYLADVGIGGGPIYPPSVPPGAPGYPTHPIWNPGAPSHPIAQPPLGIWGGPWNPPYPDQGLPPGQPGVPTHPIAQPPLGMWGPTDPRPTPPIYIPAQPVLPDSGDPTKAHLIVYVPGVGAVSFTVDLTTLPERPPPEEAAPKSA